MKILLWIAFKLRLRQKFWGDLYVKYVNRQVKKMVDSIDLDIKDIKIKNDDKDLLIK